MVRLTRVPALALTALGLLAPEARGQAPEDPRPREAKAACAAGEIQKGIRLLADLYADTEDLNWVYNQGRCYQQNGWADEAIERFQEYLRRAPDITPEERAEVQLFIAELEPRRQRRDTDVLPSGVHPPPVAAAPSSAADVKAVAPAPPDRTDRRLTIAAITLGGVGVAALAGGLVFGARVRSVEEEVAGWSVARGEGDVPYSDYENRERKARNNQIGQWVSYSVAALALGGSGACYYFKWRRRSQELAMTVAPMLTPGAGGAQLQLRF